MIRGPGLAGPVLGVLGQLQRFGGRLVYREATRKASTAMAYSAEISIFILAHFMRRLACSLKVGRPGQGSSAITSQPFPLS